MKKFMFPCIVLLFFSSTVVFAQDSIKTLGGRWTTEVNINPLQGQISLNNAINQIKVRYFITNNTALRIAFSLNNVKEDDGTKSIYGQNPIDASDVKKSTSFGLNLGFEQHLTGTRRLSPYIGAEIAFGLKYASETLEDKSGITEIKGGWQNDPIIRYDSYGNRQYIYSPDNYQKGYTSFGINLVTGFDFYIANHLFLGYELLFGFSYIKYDGLERTFTPKLGQSSNYNDNPTYSSKEHGFGPKIINGIRFGYTF